MTDRKWYEDSDNVIGLAYWLHSECAYFGNDVGNCIYLFEKPWKWEREFKLWELWKDSKTPELWADCIAAVDDDKITAEQILAEEEERNAK